RVGGGSGPRTIPAARVQLGVTAAVIIALIGVNYWLDRYSLLTKTSADATVPGGASYTDVNAVMPAKAILTGVAALIAIVFLYAAFRGTWRVPVIGVGLMVISAILVGGIYPAVVQRFQVQPNQQSAESEYIQRNIDATKADFGLSDAEITPYDAKLTDTAGALR
ncbi:UPF0182 family protein, partial [Isoptericola sp. b490]|uniref:UPF0182 family protein n=1 Tax=Actinotalea lenta TaxID=3064654 RepID=UPI0027143A6F